MKKKPVILLFILLMPLFTLAQQAYCPLFRLSFSEQSFSSKEAYFNPVSAKTYFADDSLYYRLELKNPIKHYLKTKSPKLEDYIVVLDVSVSWRSYPDEYSSEEMHESLGSFVIPKSDYNAADLFESTIFSGMLNDKTTRNNIMSKAYSKLRLLDRKSMIADLRFTFTLCKPNGKPHELVLGSGELRHNSMLPPLEEEEGDYSKKERARKRTAPDVLVKKITDLAALGMNSPEDPVALTLKDRTELYEKASTCLERAKDYTFTLSGKQVKSISTNLDRNPSISYYYSYSPLECAVELASGSIYFLNKKQKDLSWSEFTITANGKPCNFGEIDLEKLFTVEEIKRMNRTVTVEVINNFQPQLKKTYQVKVLMNGALFFHYEGARGADGERGRDNSRPGYPGGDGKNGEKGGDGPAIIAQADLVTDPETGVTMIKIKVECPSQNKVEYGLLDLVGSSVQILSSGGKGGDGGYGGTGGPHNTCDDVYKSGDGGNGGNGGNGGPGGNVKLILSEKAAAYKDIFKLLSEGNSGGEGGSEGSHGDASSYNIQCPQPKSGYSGESGKRGESLYKSKGFTEIVIGPVKLD